MMLGAGTAVPCPNHGKKKLPATLRETPLQGLKPDRVATLRGS